MKNEKKMNNKGFSLVELIIVIAIMAVLIGVLAPQYIRYVEKSRYQTDATMIDSVRNAIEIAIASNEAIYTTIPTDADTTITFSATALATGSVGWSELSTEVEKTIDLDKTKLTSKTLIASPPSITIEKGTGKVTVNIVAAP